MALSLHDRILGCLFGGACGDALGAPVEFLSAREIAARYGPGGPTSFDKAYGRVGAVTDDTQMTLFTVEGLIRADVRSRLKGICSPPGVVHHAYLRWLATQEGGYDRSLGEKALDGWLIAEKRLWSLRAPGNTCLSALRSNKVFGAPAANNSKGCGTVMRDAPWGFVCGRDSAMVFDYAAATARTTHGHPSAAYASGALAAIVARLAAGSDLPDAVARTISTQLGDDGAREVRDALVDAVRISTMPDWKRRIPELGEGWVAEEALAIAVLCALAAKTPEEAIVAAVNHGGDSDSTGAIAGNIVGTIGGVAALPPAWLAQVELADVIEILARDLSAVAEGHFDAEKEWERYPGW